MRSTSRLQHHMYRDNYTTKNMPLPLWTTVHKCTSQDSSQCNNYVTQGSSFAPSTCCRFLFGLRSLFTCWMRTCVHVVMKCRDFINGESSKSIAPTCCRFLFGPLSIFMFCITTSCGNRMYNKLRCKFISSIITAVDNSA